MVRIIKSKKEKEDELLHEIIRGQQKLKDAVDKKVDKVIEKHHHHGYSEEMAAENKKEGSAIEIDDSMYIPTAKIDDSILVNLDHIKTDKSSLDKKKVNKLRELKKKKGK